jgi:phosphatidylserine/phosphatidylglycerophosphate/cardiolipin synthase-like enzyme
MLQSAYTHPKAAHSVGGENRVHRSLTGISIKPKEKANYRRLSAAILELFLLFSLLLTACDHAASSVILPIAPTTSSINTVSSTVEPGDPQNITAYFTNPDGGIPANQNGLPDAAIIMDINQAKSSVDIAMYNFSLENVAQALIRARQRGVTIRLVAESDALDGGVFSELNQNGITALGDRHEGLMHNKFIVIDRQILWTGSLNLTGSGLNNDNNNAVRIVSQDAAQIYSDEFEKMYVKDQFGPDRPHSPAAKPILMDGHTLQIYFSPDQSVSPRLVEAIRAAKQSVEFMAYSFTSDPIAAAIIAQAKTQVVVRGIVDESQVSSNTNGQYSRLRKAGVNVFLDGNTGLMHHKVIILDHETVIFGSYNFTASAEKTNDENLVIFHDPDIARQFEAEFERVYALAQH